MSDFRTVASLEDVPESQPTAVEVDGTELVLIRQSGKVYALEDRCSHEDFPLSEGEIMNGQVECALHGARFELESGTPKALPAVKPVKIFECRVEGDEIQVRLE